MSKDLLSNWEKKSADRQKVYKQYLQKANKNDVLRTITRPSRGGIFEN